MCAGLPLLRNAKCSGAFLSVHAYGLLQHYERRRMRKTRYRDERSQQSEYHGASELAWRRSRSSRLDRASMTCGMLLLRWPECCLIECRTWASPWIHIRGLFVVYVPPPPAKLSGGERPHG
ncbi:hypothetical protein PsYK624_015280 [Phanerochaete sordida]|uniref:Uncharacterized protein n=1 Tax=Phanerochaete sordida TaxID=48140 RepID=A0A9P3L8F1_9APHY|nr:hypothetical protein PsYK624_015280 [Phanerochaete sordida]